MNGAQALIRTLANCGVELCLANPGTSEMHLVEALDGEPRVRSVLALFEGVCSGAADGYGRMTGRPAATLLHLGPGMANGIANFHNARRAGTPMINLVGNHPAYHIGYDAPLTSDIDTLARNFSSWIKSSGTADTLARDGAEAVMASRHTTPGSRGRIASLIIGADAAWGESPGAEMPEPPPQRATVDTGTVQEIARVLAESEKTVILLEQHGTSRQAMEAAGRISARTGCRLMTHTFPARVESGAGSIRADRMPYFPEQIQKVLEGTRHLILVGGNAPTSFFAYPDTPSRLVPEDCQVHTLARTDEDAVDALQRVAAHLDAENTPPNRVEASRPERPSGEMSRRHMTQAVAATLPEQAIVATDSGAGAGMFPYCQGANPHTWLSLTGGSIGQGGPAATGAALACPDRPVLALLGDGGATYTIQCLWTQAREGLNVTTVIFANNTYNILNLEYSRLGVEEVGEIAASLFDINRPRMDWVSIASGFGVPGAVADSAESLAELLERGYREPGPFLIQANC